VGFAPFGKEAEGCYGAGESGEIGFEGGAAVLRRSGKRDGVGGGLEEDVGAA
jgi:hypothetical protein